MVVVVVVVVVVVDGLLWLMVVLPIIAKSQNHGF